MPAAPSQGALLDEGLHGAPSPLTPPRTGRPPGRGSSQCPQPPHRAPSWTRSPRCSIPHPLHGALRGPIARPSRALPSLAHLGLLCSPTGSPKGLIHSWMSLSCPRARELLGLRPLPTQLRALLTPCEPRSPSKNNCLRGGLSPLTLGRVRVPRLGA